MGQLAIAALIARVLADDASPSEILAERELQLEERSEPKEKKRSRAE